MLTWMLLLYMFTGAGIAVFVIFWALRSRQFQEQDRARFLPLRDLSDEELQTPARRKLAPSVVFLGLVMILGVGAVLRVLFLMAGP